MKKLARQREKAAKAAAKASAISTTEAERRVEEDDDDDKKKSNRLKFKETPVPKSIQKYLEMVGLGIPSRRRKTRKSRSMFFQSLEQGRRTGQTGSSTTPPPPFSSAGGGGGSRDDLERRVVVIGRVSSVHDTLPTNIEKIPEVVRTFYCVCVCSGQQLLS